MADKKQQLKSIDELRALDKTGLTTKVAELKSQLAEQQRSHAAQELPSAAVIGKTRKEIAQTLTVLRQVTLSEKLVAKAPEAKEEEK